MRKNGKQFTALLAFAALFGSSLLTSASPVSAQSKNSRDRQTQAPKADRSRESDDSNFTRTQAERFDQANKKNEDRNERAPAKNKPRR
jgi:hypothetical protein